MEQNQLVPNIHKHDHKGNSVCAEIINDSSTVAGGVLSLCSPDVAFHFTLQTLDRYSTAADLNSVPLDAK
jgi:hypothetical protein